MGRLWGKMFEYNLFIHTHNFLLLFFMMKAYNGIFDNIGKVVYMFDKTGTHPLVQIKPMTQTKVSLKKSTQFIQI